MTSDVSRVVGIRARALMGTTNAPVSRLFGHDSVLRPTASVWATCQQVRQMRLARVGVTAVPYVYGATTPPSSANAGEVVGCSFGVNVVNGAKRPLAAPRRAATVHQCYGQRLSAAPTPVAVGIGTSIAMPVVMLGAKCGGEGCGPMGVTARPGAPFSRRAISRARWR